jgi:hypothetical protein
LYKVPNWKYNGNKIEIDSAALREINKKYNGNRVEIDSASLREINRKYDGNRVEIDFAALACGRQAKGIVPNSLRLCSLPRRIAGRYSLFLFFSQRRRDAKE